MAKFANVDKMVKNLEGMKKLGYDAIAIDGMIKGLQESAVADAVEVVRCKDCVRCLLTHSEDENSRYCGKFLFYPKADDFCSYGERKEEPEDG